MESEIKNQERGIHVKQEVNQTLRLSYYTQKPRKTL